MARADLGRLLSRPLRLDGGFKGVKGAGDPDRDSPNPETALEVEEGDKAGEDDDDEEADDDDDNEHVEERRRPSKDSSG